MISNPYSSRNEIVGTTKMSIAAIPSAWLQRNVFHPCEGGALLRAIYLATLVWPISIPSLRSSPWILGAPHNGLAVLISRISRRISKGTVGRPRRRLDFQRQYDRNPARCQRITVSGRTIANALLTMGNNRQAPPNISLSIELKGSFLGQARRSTLSCCLSTTVSSAARDRKRSTIIPKNNLLHSDIEQQHRPILCQPATGSDLRQGQVRRSPRRRLSRQNQCDEAAIPSPCGRWQELASIDVSCCRRRARPGASIRDNASMRRQHIFVQPRPLADRRNIRPLWAEVAAKHHRATYISGGATYSTPQTGLPNNGTPRTCHHCCSDSRQRPAVDVLTGNRIL